MLRTVGLIHRGFPPALVRLKQQLDRRHGSLPKENPGSKWPKTSLGAVKDGYRLTPEQLHTLLRICRSDLETKMLVKSFAGKFVCADASCRLCFEL